MQFFRLWKIFLDASQNTKKTNRFGVLVAAIIIRSYQLLVSPLFGSVCRFSPSCSHYALQAINRHGLIKGLGLAIRRLMRCHPWNAGGYDPVP